MTHHVTKVTFFNHIIGQVSIKITYILKGAIRRHCFVKPGVCPGLLKLMSCGRRYACVSMCVCLCVSTLQAIKNYSREMKSE